MLSFQSHHTLRSLKAILKHLRITNCGVYGRHDFIPRIVSMLQKSPSTKALDLQNIRLKVVISERDKELVYFVDRMGRISREDTGNMFELVDDGMKLIHESIMQYRGVVDKKPETDPWGEYDEWRSIEK